MVDTTELGKACIALKLVYEEICNELELVQERHSKFARIPAKKEVDDTLLGLEKDAQSIQRVITLLTKRKNDEHNRSLVQAKIFTEFQKGIHNKGKAERTWMYSQLLRVLRKDLPSVHSN